LSTNLKGPPEKGGKPNPNTAPISPSSLKLKQKCKDEDVKIESPYRVSQDAFFQAENCLIDESGDQSQLKVFRCLGSLWLQFVLLQNGHGVSIDFSALRVLFIDKASFATLAT
jgi:hypothetical protein